MELMKYPPGPPGNIYHLVKTNIIFTTTVSDRGYVILPSIYPVWQFVRQAPFEFEPGTTWSYNSFHLQVAGAMAASAAGISTQEILWL